MAKNLDKLPPGLQMKVGSIIKFQSAKKTLLKAIGATNRSALQAFAEATAEDAKDRVPVVSGLLQSSIKGKVRKKRGGREGEFQASISTNTKGKSQKKRYANGKIIIVESNGYGYGLDVEVGRADGHYTNTPYLRPAFSNQAKRIPELMKRAAEIEALKQNPPTKRRGRPRLNP